MPGYILKTAPIKQFIASLEATLPHSRKATVNLHGEARAPQLTGRQQDILDLLHQGCSSKEMAARLCITVGTVDNHVAAILSAFDVKAEAMPLQQGLNWAICSAAIRGKTMALHGSRRLTDKPIATPSCVNFRSSAPNRELR